MLRNVLTCYIPEGIVTSKLDTVLHSDLTCYIPAGIATRNLQIMLHSVRTHYIPVGIAHSHRHAAFRSVITQHQLCPSRHCEQPSPHCFSQCHHSPPTMSQQALRAAIATLLFAVSSLTTNYVPAGIAASFLSPETSCRKEWQLTRRKSMCTITIELRT